MLSNNDAQNSYSLFQEKFACIYDECFPLRYKKLGYKERKPWLSDGLKMSIKRKNKNRDLEAEYISYRNLLNKLLREAERKYYRLLLEKKQKQYEKVMESS